MARRRYRRVRRNPLGGAEFGMIAALLVPAGFRLLELRPEEVGLEEVFLRVTKGETQ